MSEEYIGVTQQIFEDVISKPKLLDKYLRRPPFRFIHDIIINTMKATGFPEGLFEEKELNSKAVKDKHDKIAWLNKLIKCIESVHTEALNVNPHKLVAGLEPEYTNEMLQIFGQIAIKVANGQLSMQDIFNKMLGNNSENNVQISPHEQSQQSTEIQHSQSPPQQSPVQIQNPPSPPENTIEEKKEQIDTDDFVTQTKQTLGKLIERPRLLDKLLRRPPFRFLHDIIKSLINATGYPLQFLDESKDITNADIKDPKFKYYFLIKLITIVSATINDDLSFIDPKNIIAGRKAEDTNYLLSKLAYAATLQIDISEINKKINTISANRKSKKNSAKKQKQKTQENTPRNAQKKSETNVSKNKDTFRKSAPVMPKLELDQIKINNVQINSKNDVIKPSAILNERLSKRQMQQQNQQQIQTQKPFQAIQKKLQRPRTARRAPPKLKTNVIEEKEIESKTDILIMDDNEIETVEDIGVMDTADNNDMNLDELNGFMGNENAENVCEELSGTENDGNHGKLVRDILDAQSGIRIQTSRLGTHRRGDSAKSTEKIENMREMIQKLCQTCVPLGKCIDFVFEDVESINNELLKWKQQITTNKARLVEEKEQTEQVLAPLRKELRSIKAEIKRQNQLILQKKAVLLRNETKTNDIILKRLLNE